MQSLTPGATGVELSWEAPMQSHDWRLVLLRDTATLAYSSQTHRSGGTITASLDYALSPGTSYTLDLLTSDDFNQSIVALPFDYTAP
ncbi:MAG TPA: hypothetical protein VJ957_12460 [Longimicrobiales bacterium]|nr:hypothetical protein [Longimicrobiales bacterium]